MGTVMVPFSFAQNFIFDLDGTLLDTIFDINVAINLALKQCGYDYQYNLEETKQLIGDGADKCVERALTLHNQDLQGFPALKAAYMPLYKTHQNEHVKPFDGLKQTLEELHRLGAKLFVVTNKPDALAQVVVPFHYGDKLFDAIIGAQEGKKVKPDPWQVNLIMERFALDKEKTVFVGDSITDILTGHNAGLKTILVKWGYGFYDKATLTKADKVITKPEELLQISSK